MKRDCYREALLQRGLDLVLQELHEFLEHDELEEAEYAFFERQIHEVETLKSAIQTAAWGPDR